MTQITESDIAEASNDLHSLVDFIRWGASRFSEAGLFFGHGTDNAIDEALALVLHALHLPHGLDSELFQSRLTEREKRAVLGLFQERLETRVPAAYLTNEAWFAGLGFYVDHRVLVPRSPISELIQERFEPWLQARSVSRVLDMCTGSGCIAIACAMAFPEAEVDAVDVSADALAVARINIERFGLDQRVHAIESDLFNSLPATRYDLIVSNPPYVAEAEMADLPDEFRHEPALGLTSGVAGLDAVVRILQQAHAYLQPDGLLVVEVGNAQFALAQAFPQVPFQWLTFQRGGEGVFALTADDLDKHAQDFKLP
jgi:ribosomal protein L3 glutamine methyltransferase